MSLQIIIPDNEEKMKPTDLILFKENIAQILLKKTISQKDIDELNLNLGKLQGYLVVADKKKLKEYFDNFMKLNFLELLNIYLDKNIDGITFSILQFVNFLTINIQNQELLEYIYSIKFATKVFGQQMNIIDKIISLDFKKNEECLTHQINFIKSLSQKINIDSLKYFYDCNINQFPILTKSLSLYNYNDPLIRNVVKNIFLAVVNIDNNNLREFLISFPINLYYSNIIFQLKNRIMDLCLIDLGVDGGKKTFGKLQKEHDYIIDTIFYIGDLLSLNIEKINFILINCLLNEIILPLIYSLINNKNDKITMYDSLYILGLFLFSVKNEFIYKVITYFLFNEKISNNLLFKLSSFPFNVIEKKIMGFINFLITNYLYADINEPSWQTIKNFMRKTNGIDLSIGEIDKDNIYDFSKNLMIDDKDMVKNSIFETIKTYFLCNDDALVLILNLIINSFLNFKKSSNEKEKNDKDVKNINENANDDDGFNLINDNEEEQLKGKNNDNLLNNRFFNILNNDNKSGNILNILLSYLIDYKTFRLATYEVILINIQLLIKTFLEKNNNNPEYKKIFILKLIEAIDKQFEKMEKLLKLDKCSNRYLLSSSIKAYDYYIKKTDKKINDLITLPNILVPIIYIDKIEEIPDNLREDKDNDEILRSYITIIFFLNDIINDLVGNQNEIIKSQRFPLQIETIKFSMGKIYNEKELGEDYVHCKIYRNNTYVPSEAILSSDTLYFGEIIGGNMDDLSKIKIFKKIPMRYLHVMSGDSNVTLNIIDKTSKITEKNVIKMHCLNVNNTKTMYNYLTQQIIFCLNLEESLFSSFMEEMRKKLHRLV